MQSKPPAGEKGQVVQQPKVARAGGARRFMGHGLLFVLVGLVLYSGVYAWSERLVYEHTELNRLYKIKTAQTSTYDWVILGASHALVMDLRDMNARLEKMTGAKILNLGEMGGGPAISGVLLDYFLAGHQTRAVVYFVDSFSFYSQDWNEGRLKDVGLYQRAPFDPALVKVLLQNPATRWVGLDYLFGFSKNNFWVTERINNSLLFKSDISSFPQAARFTRVNPPLPQFDRTRMNYLYGSIRITGTHNGEANAVSLTDTTKNFSLGVAVGSTLTNTTDGSSTTITAITTTTKPNDTLVGLLAGGAENDWDVGDAYLYPGKEVNQELFQRYMEGFEDQLSLLKDKGIRVVLIRPPLPDRIYKMIPNEAWFEGVIKGVAEKHGVELYDFTHSVPNEKLYMDEDHLNEAGMMFFSENFLKQVLTAPAS